MLSTFRLTALLVVTVLFASACASNNVLELGVGDCFDDPGSGFEEVADVPMVDCSEPHDNEVYYVYEIDALGTEAEYAEECLAAFEGYVGSDYASSEIFFSMLWPLPEGFAQGDNEVVCFGYLEPPLQLTGTIKDSGR